MASGLILSGLGQGIANAGQSVGSFMFKGIESELNDERALQKAAALERLKEQMIEERAQKDAAKALEVDSRATRIGEDRAGKLLQADAGKLAANAGLIGGAAPAMTEEEMKAHLESLSPSERKALEGTGLISRALGRNEQRLQSAEDQIQAARELGASSTLLKSYQDSKKSVLEEIKAENTEKRNEQRHQETMAQQERLSKQFQVTAGIMQQNADSNRIRAEKPPSGAADPNKPATTADLQRQITAAQNSLATELGVAKNDVNAEIASLKKKAANGNAKAQATLDGVQPYLDELSSANKRMLEFKRASPGSSGAAPTPAPAASSGDNRPSRPPLSSFRG